MAGTVVVRRPRAKRLGTVDAWSRSRSPSWWGWSSALARPPAGVHTIRPRVEQIGLLALGAGPQRACRWCSTARHRSSRWSGSLAVLIAVAVANRHLTGVAVIGVGLLLNLVSVAVNGGHAGAGQRAGGRRARRRRATRSERGRSPRTSRPRRIRCRCSATCSPSPFAGEVVSFGDLIVVVGAADAVRELSRRRARPLAVARAQRPARTTSASVDQVWGTAPRGAPGVGHPVLGEPGALAHPSPSTSTRAERSGGRAASWSRPATAGR